MKAAEHKPCTLCGFPTPIEMKGHPVCGQCLTKSANEFLAAWRLALRQLVSATPNQDAA